MKNYSTAEKPRKILEFCDFLIKILENCIKLGDPEVLTRFPLGLENLENREAFSSQGILKKKLERSGKITQNTGKLREIQTNVICYILVIFK